MTIVGNSTEVKNLAETILWMHANNQTPHCHSFRDGALVNRKMGHFQYRCPRKSRVLAACLINVFVIFVTLKAVADEFISESVSETSPTVQVVGDRFEDALGRQVLLHGLSVISKSSKDHYLSWHREDDFAQMARWGMNCIRLGILWDGVEPQPGRYDARYLDGVAIRLDWAAKHGIYVFPGHASRPLFGALF